MDNARRWWIKLNTDGSCMGDPPRGGFGGVLRDDTGSWICRFSAKPVRVDALSAELHALRFGLNLA